MDKKYSGIFIAAAVAVCFVSAAYARETPFKLSEGVDKTAESEAQPKSQLERILKAKRDFEDKYGTSFAFIINSQIQSALYAKTNEGKSRAAWYYNVGLEQRLWKDAYTHFEFEGGHNKGIDKLLPTFSVFNSAAGETSYAYITRFYLNQDLFSRKGIFGCG